MATSIRQPENIGKLTKTSSTTVQLASSRVNIGGKQYFNSQPLSLSIATLGAGGLDASFAATKLYYVFAVVSNGTVSLIASQSTAPSGFGSYRLVGHFFTDSSNVYQAWSAGEYDSESTNTRFKDNFLINGGFDFIQRFDPAIGAVNPASGALSFDRWHAWDASVNATLTRQSSGAPLGSTYFARITNTGIGASNLSQAVESIFVDAMKGKVCTFSILVRRNSILPDAQNFIEVEKSATANSRSATWTSIATKTLTGVPVSTGSSSDWVRYSLQFYVPNDGTANGLRFNLRYLTTQPSGAILEWAQAMVNEGPIPAPFKLMGREPADELRLCQRYYEKTFPLDVAPATNAGTTNAIYTIATTRATILWTFAAEKRTASYTPVFFNPSAANSNFTSNPSAPAVEGSYPTTKNLLVYSSTTNVTSGNGYMIHIAVDCEL